MLKFEDLAINAVMLHHEDSARFYEVIGIYSDRYRQYLLVNRNGDIAQMESGGQIYSELFSSWGELNDVFTDVRNDRLKQGYHKDIDTTYQTSKAIFSAEAVQARVAYLSERGILSAFTDGVDIKPHSSIVSFFKGCGVNSKDDMSNFLLGITGHASAAETPKPILSKVRSAMWGSW